MTLEDKYISVYEKLGAAHFVKSEDRKLKKWGKTDEDIRKMKIECVKYHLRYYIRGIETYKALNE